MWRNPTIKDHDLNKLESWIPEYDYTNGRFQLFLPNGFLRRKITLTNSKVKKIISQRYLSRRFLKNSYLKFYPHPHCGPPLLYSIPTPTISICLFHHVFTQYVKLFILEAFGHWYIITLFLFYFALQLQHHGNVFWKFIEADTYSIAKRGITLLLCPWQKSDERVT